MSTPERPKRLSLSEIIELILTRGQGDRSSITLGRTAAGDTTIEVKVRTGDDGEIATAAHAAQQAQAIYDRLRDLYPSRREHDNAEVSFTRNAKGETQVSVSAKTSNDGHATMHELERATSDVYDTARMRYPMADGHTAKPGTVAPKRTGAPES